MPFPLFVVPVHCEVGGTIASFERSSASVNTAMFFCPCTLVIEFGPSSQQWQLGLYPLPVFAACDELYNSMKFVLPVNVAGCASWNKQFLLSSA